MDLISRILQEFAKFAKFNPREILSTQGTYKNVLTNHILLCELWQIERQKIAPLYKNIRKYYFCETLPILKKLESKRNRLIEQMTKLFGIYLHAFFFIRKFAFHLLIKIFLKLDDFINKSSLKTFF